MTGERRCTARLKTSCPACAPESTIATTTGARVPRASTTRFQASFALIFSNPHCSASHFHTSGALNKDRRASPTARHSRRAQRPNRGGAREGDCIAHGFFQIGENAGKEVIELQLDKQFSPIRLQCVLYRLKVIRPERAFCRIGNYMAGNIERWEQVAKPHQGCHADPRF